MFAATPTDRADSFHPDISRSWCPSLESHPNLRPRAPFSVLPIYVSFKLTPQWENGGRDRTRTGSLQNMSLTCYQLHYSAMLKVKGVFTFKNFRIAFCIRYSIFKNQFSLAHPLGFEPRSDEFGARNVASYTRDT